jgi:hypothetical protein
MVVYSGDSTETSDSVNKNFLNSYIRYGVQMRLHYLMLFSSDNLKKLFRKNCYLLLYLNIHT